MVVGMQITAKHREVEAGFRLLLAEHEIAPPDRVGYEPASVVFFFEEPKLAVVVDFDGPSDGFAPPGPRLAGRRAVEERGGAHPGTSDDPDHGGL